MGIQADLSDRICRTLIFKRTAVGWPICRTTNFQSHHPALRDSPSSRQGHRKLARHTVPGSSPPIKSVLKGRRNRSIVPLGRIIHGDVHRGRCPRLISVVAPRLLRRRRGLFVEPQIFNHIIPLCGIHPLPSIVFPWQPA